MDRTDMIWRGSASQTRAAATGRARSPTFGKRIRRTISGDDDVAESDDELE